MITYDFLRNLLGEPESVFTYAVSEGLAGLFPDRAIVESYEGSFDLECYARAGRCRLHPIPGVHHQLWTTWDESTGIKKTARNVWYQVDWEGDSLEVLIVTRGASYCDETYVWILADDEPTADRFLAEVSAWNAEIRDEVLVFQGGCWFKSPTLFEEIRNATFENLILAGTLRHDIREDAERFFAAKDLYEGHGIPWKRGVLFIGPAGNGKTHTVKALVNTIKKPCLYVKSLQDTDATSHDSLRRIFSKARKLAPCILVLEDLDSLVDEPNRSFFLNEIDGFSANTGIFTLATTNHPERLDPAIIDRPSRFDRKYHFGLPGWEERRAFLSLRYAGAPGEAPRPSAVGLDIAASRTDGFSFAYLKELCLSAMMRWVGMQSRIEMDRILVDEVDVLRAQMASRPPAAKGA